MNIAMTEPKAAVVPSLKGKVSLITGSTSGIGLGIARALAGAGSDVVRTVSASRKRSKLHETASPRITTFASIIPQPTCRSLTRSPR